MTKYLNQKLLKKKITLSRRDRVPLLKLKKSLYESQSF